MAEGSKGTLPVNDDEADVGFQERIALPRTVVSHPYREDRKTGAIRWLDKPAEHDYPAAASYLTLIFPPKIAEALVGELKQSPISCFKARDIVRASGLSLVGVSNSRVEKHRQKIMRGENLSPLLLVRNPPTACVIVADGYHRLCSIYGVDEDALIRCQIV